MTGTTLTAEQLVLVHAEGHVQRGTSPFEDPHTMSRYCKVLNRRGELWAASVLGRDLSRRSLTWGPWLERGEAEVLVLADECESQRTHR